MTRHCIHINISTTTALTRLLPIHALATTHHEGPVWSNVMLLMFIAEAAAEDAFTTRAPKRTSVVFVNLRMAKGRAGMPTRAEEKNSTKNITQTTIMHCVRHGEHA